MFLFFLNFSSLIYTMFETLNAILGADVLRYSLTMGTGALIGYTLWPLPSAIDKFASSSILKFGTLFLFGLLAAYPINLSKFMVVFLAALLIMILFEYLRQVDKGLSAVPAAKAAVKEFMWNNPMDSYPAEAPYADPRMGIPQYLPDGTTPAVTFAGHAGGVSFRGSEHMRDALYQDYPLSYPAAAPYGDQDWGIPSEMPDGSPGLVYASHVEQFMNPISASFVELRALSINGLNTLADASRGIAASVGIRDKEKYENRIRSALLQIRDISQQGVNMVSQSGRNIAANMGMVNHEQFANPLQSAFMEVQNASRQGLQAALQLGRNTTASIFSSKECLSDPLQDIFSQMNAVSKRGMSAIGFGEPLANPIPGIAQRGLRAVKQFGRGVVSAAGLNPEKLFNPLDAAFVIPTQGLGVLVPGLE